MGRGGGPIVCIGGDGGSISISESSTSLKLNPVVWIAFSIGSGPYSVFWYWSSNWIASRSRPSGSPHPQLLGSPWTACKFFRQLAARKEEEEELEEEELEEEELEEEEPEEEELEE